MKGQASTYGVSVGGFRPTEETPITINLERSGMNVSVAASQIEDGEAANAVDVRFDGGGIANDYDYAPFGAAYAGAGNSEVLHIANYDKKVGDRFLMRLRDTHWDRWNGVNWLELPGVLGSSVADRYTSLVAEDTFVAANGVDRLKAWDGVDANAVADLSADSPIARYITKIGTRILAAYLKIGVDFQPDMVAWSEDGNIRGWTNPLLGAGSAVPPSEGANRLPNFIRGLSTLQRGAVIYRQQSVQLATLTGVGAAPFRFTTLDFSHGTESPYSIVSGGMEVGDYFLGSDYMPYLFNGDRFLPIGMPIHKLLKSAISERGLVVGAIDTNEQEYYIAYPSAGNDYLTEAWVFNIKEMVKNQRLCWRRKTLPLRTLSFGYDFIGTVSDPIVDTITDIVDTITIRVDDWDNAEGPERILFGDEDGQIHYTDKNTPIDGKWESKNFLYGNNEVKVDRCRLKYTAPSAATVGVSVSTDGGKTYGSETVYVFAPTGAGDNEITDTINVVGRQIMFRIRPLTGFSTVHQLVATIQNLGTTNG